MTSRNYNDNVFLNCPFDSAYKALFDALVFTIYDCGFMPDVLSKKQMQAKSGLRRFTTWSRTVATEFMTYQEQN